MDLFDVKIKVWSELASSETIANAFEMSPDVAHSLGERRVRGDHSIYDRSYCLFKLGSFPKDKALDVAIAKILRAKELLIQESGLLKSQICITVPITSVSFDMDFSQTKKLCEVTSGLSLEIGEDG